MSEADRRKWAIEFIKYGERLAVAGGQAGERLDLFAEADTLVAYISGPAKTAAPSHSPYQGVNVALVT